MSYVDPDTGLKLGTWLTKQRQLKKRKKNPLDPERVERLERLGVWWDQPDKWDEYFGALERYKEGPGNGDPNCVNRLRRPRHRPESRPMA